MERAVLWEVLYPPGSNPAPAHDIEAPGGTRTILQRPLRGAVLRWPMVPPLGYRATLPFIARREDKHQHVYVIDIVVGIEALAISSPI